jgi:2-iminobutanoate/2-iminopropanoate deaminase
VTKKRIETAKAPKPVGPYSQGVCAGNLLFASGQIPLDPATGQVVEGDIEVQTDRVLQNLMEVLKEAKMSTTNVVKTTVYLTNLGDFARMNAVYERYLGKEPPARTTIQAAALPRGVKVEIDLIAAF